MLNLSGIEFFIGPLVLAECGDITQISEAIASGSIEELSEDDVPGSRAIEIQTKHNLGLGESECIAFCQTRYDYVMCSEDRRARSVAASALGKAAVTGVLGLLKRCVTAGFLTPKEAMRSVERMVACGAFLPRVSQSFFESP